jgi:preprotein translocase subunit Sec63
LNNKNKKMRNIYLLILIVFVIIEERIAVDDLYKILGLKRSASKGDIKKAYRTKARDTHPDKNLKDQEAASSI